MYSPRCLSPAALWGRCRQPCPGFGTLGPLVAAVKLRLRRESASALPGPVLGPRGPFACEFTCDRLGTAHLGVYLAPRAGATTCLLGIKTSSQPATGGDEVGGKPVCRFGVDLGRDSRCPHHALLCHCTDFGDVLSNVADSAVLGQQKILTTPSTVILDR